MGRAWSPKLAALTTGLLLAWCPRVSALDPSLNISQYAHTSWKVSDGFTRGMIESIAQTPDGYLWLGTEFGLFRFDGVRAVPWQPPAGEKLPNDIINTLLVTRDGTLWIGTDKGLASWKNGRLTDYREVKGYDIASLVEDRDGTVWAGEWGLQSPEELCSIRAATVQCFGADGSLGLGAMRLYEDRKGNLWVGTTGGFWHWRPGPPKFYAIPGQIQGPQSFIEDTDGSLLLAVDEILRFSGGKVEVSPYFLPSPGQGPRASLFLRDRDGALWIGTASNGVLRLRHGRADLFNSSDGLSDDRVLALFEDREGDLWVGTHDGLDRFRNFAIPTWSTREGLQPQAGGAVFAATDGTVWAGSSNGLSSLKQGRVMIYRQRPERNDPNTGRPEQEKIDPRMPQAPLGALFEDHRGRLWVSSRGALGYLENDEFHPMSSFGTNVPVSIAEDASGNLWLSGQKDGLFRFRDGQVIQKISWDTEGFNEFGKQLAVDPLNGGLWIGFANGSVGHYKDGHLRESYATSNGLGEGAVNNLRLDPNGTLWAATDGGLSRIKEGHVLTLTSKDGLPCDHVHWSIEDDEHSVWLYTPCGLVRIAHFDLDAWSSYQRRQVQTTVFDSSDGVRSFAQLSSFSPPVSKAPDGKIWFGALDGVSVIDPRNLHLNKLPPPVHVEQITADRKTYDASSNVTGESSSHLRLPPLVRDLEIDYTALSFVAPEKNLFRVKLEGRDRDWQDVGNRRQAFYTNLSPGNYRFRVTASNNSGVWNEAGTFLDFSIAPAYYQTNGFRLSCVIAFMLMLWGLYQLRLRQLAHQFNMRLEERVGERTRIARDLHDTLLQNLHGLLFRFQAARNMLPRRTEEAMEALDGAISRTEQAISESRDTIKDLRYERVTSTDLAELLTQTGRELESGADANGNPPIFRVIVEGERQTLSPVLQDEVYRIARELLRNAFQHARARHIEAEIRYDHHLLRVLIRDDGKGMDANVLKEGGQPGHWGLPGVRERAKQIGARLDFWSEAGAGTEVQLTIPISVGSERPGDGSRFRLFGKSKSS